RLAYPLAAAAAVAAIIVVLAVVLPGLSGRSPGDQATSPSNGSPIGPGTHTSTYASPLSALVIRDGNGTVTITGSHRRSVQVTTTITAPVPGQAVTSSVRHGALQLSYTAPDCGSGHRTCPRVNYVLRVPAALPVQVIAGAGTVSLSGLSGPARVTDGA